jgi:methyl-accepting chemotaxis protein WspA
VVVATEIRRLADQTAVATYDIEQMVREIQSSVSAGVMGMDKFSEEVRRGMADMQQVGDQLSQIIQQVQTLAPRVQMVNEGMQAQATGAEQINQALQQLSDAAQQTVESLRQSTLAIEELTLVANDLRSGVSRFKVGWLPWRSALPLLRPDAGCTCCSASAATAMRWTQETSPRCWACARSSRCRARRRGWPA